MTDANPNALWARCIIEELVRGGVRDICISPGSRSTPLTLAAASEERLRVHNHIDERSAAFFALGCSKITGQPTVLICTSGSAGAHYHPAIIEALYARVPLIALTADRPVELVGTGAGQTIVQQNMYGPHVLLEHHLELPSLDGQSLRRLRFKLDQAVATSKGRVGARAPGPVHINVPFREPLEPTPVEMPATLAQDAPLALSGRREAPFIEHVSPRGLAHPEHVDALVDACQFAKRGVIVCGPHELIHGELREGLLALAEATGFPLLADPVSSLRYGRGSEAIVSRYDAILRSKRWRAAHAPDLVLRFGAQPTSKVYRFWREEHPEATEILIDPFGDVFDQPQQATMVIAAPPGALATKVAANLPTSEPTPWTRSFESAESLATSCLEKALDDELFWEGWIARELVEQLPDEGMLWCASSMPIRDVDGFAPRREESLHVLASRGANGIDGLIASALGATSALDAPGALLIGDVAFLHDHSSLLSASRGLDARVSPQLKIILVNNGGGGIFEHLPIAKHKQHYERHFLTPHQTDFELICQAHGVPYTKVTTKEGFADVLGSCFAREGVEVIEAVVDLNENVARHRRAWADVTEALENTL